mgnify:CR=1 FL=1
MGANNEDFNGLCKMYLWINWEIERECQEGNKTDFSKSEVVQHVEDFLMQLGKDKSAI